MPLFIQREMGYQCGNWMTNLQEYELDFKMFNIMKDQCLCKLVTKDIGFEDQEEDR
jgi:hypothetical protein